MEQGIFPLENDESMVVHMTEALNPLGWSW